MDEGISSNRNSGGLTTSQLAGVIVGSIVITVLLGFLGICTFIRRRRKARRLMLSPRSSGFYPSPYNGRGEEDARIISPRNVYFNKGGSSPEAADNEVQSPTTPIATEPNPFVQGQGGPRDHLPSLQLSAGNHDGLAYDVIAPQGEMTGGSGENTGVSVTQMQEQVRQMSNHILTVLLSNQPSSPTADLPVNEPPPGYRRSPQPDSSSLLVDSPPQGRF